MDNNRKKGTNYGGSHNTEREKNRRGLESTLDYYNDDISKKLVGKLFDDYVKSEEEDYFDIERKDDYDDRDYEQDYDGYEEESYADDDSGYNYDDLSLYAPRRRRGRKKSESVKKSERIKSINPEKKKEVVPKKKSVRITDEEFDNGFLTNDDIEQEQKQKNSKNNTVKIIFASMMIVFLVILSGFAYKLNSLNSKLKEAEEKLTADKTSYEEKINNLNSQITALTQENTQNNAENKNNENIQNNNENNNSENNSENNQESDSIPTEYTVQKGDSIWKISKKVYGDGKLYVNILDANNLPENTNLQEGQKLVIPPK